MTDLAWKFSCPKCYTRLISPFGGCDKCKKIIETKEGKRMTAITETIKRIETLCRTMAMASEESPVIFHTYKACIQILKEEAEKENKCPNCKNYVISDSNYISPHCKFHNPETRETDIDDCCKWNRIYDDLYEPKEATSEDS